MTKTLTGFNRPARTTLIVNQRARYESNMPSGDFMLGQGLIPRMPEMDAESQNAMHAHLDRTAMQSHPLYATGDWLNEWARTFGITRKSATVATASVDLAGVNTTDVPVGTEFVRADGVVYAVTQGGTIADGALTVTVAANQSGLAGNADAGVTLSVVAPIVGLQSTGTIAVAGATGGADAEVDGAPGVVEHFRGRIINRLRAPAHGGNADDYRTWALEVPGVTRAWVTRLGMGAATVTVRFMMDDTYADGIPLGDGAPDYSGDLKTVFDYIEGHEDPGTGRIVGRPEGAEVFVVAPVAVAFNVTITGLSPDTAEIRAQISAELADMVRRRAAPGVTISRSWIAEAVSIAAGEDTHDLTAPASSITHEVGEIAVLGNVTYA